MPPIYLCIHCDSKVKGTGKYCEFCNSAEKRRDMDRAKEKHFKEHGFEYECKRCKK